MFDMSKCDYVSCDLSNLGHWYSESESDPSPIQTDSIQSKGLLIELLANMFKFGCRCEAAATPLIRTSSLARKIQVISKPEHWN